MRIAVYHPCLARGGSEVRAMWLIQALKARHEMTLITGCRPDIERLNAACGTSVGERDVRVRLPRAHWLMERSRGGAAIKGAYFRRFAAKAAPSYDLSISAYNPCDFGRPGIQFIADFSWDEELRSTLHGDALARDSFGFPRQQVPRRLYLGMARLIAGGGRHDPLDRDQWVIANSRWSAERLQERFGVRAPVVYPPVPSLATGLVPEERAADFACLGRIAPEKRIVEIIQIVEGVRSLGHAVGLRILGPLEDSGYVRNIRRLARARPWARLEGYRVGAEKARILGQCRYGIHACVGEAFGIAVAEMVAAGCLTFGPSEGGVAEILSHPDLTFSGPDDAIGKIVRVLEDNSRRAALLAHLGAQGDRFSTQAFSQRVRDLVEDWFVARQGGNRVPLDRGQGPIRPRPARPTTRTQTPMSEGPTHESG